MGDPVCTYLSFNRASEREKRPIARTSDHNGLIHTVLYCFHVLNLSYIRRCLQVVARKLNFYDVDAA